MTVSRRFLIASSLARLVRRERSGAPLIEGYFPNRPHRSAGVQLEEARGRLLLLTEHPDGSTEEWAELPIEQADALVAVTEGQAYYLRTILWVGQQEVHLEHFRRPGPLDLITVAFEHRGEEHAFAPPPWFGPEVSTDSAYQHRDLALNGLPPRLEVDVTGEALHSLLDLLEDRATSWLHDLGTQAGAGLHGLPSVAQPSWPIDEEHPAENEDRGETDRETEEAVIQELALPLRPR